jgi:DNA-binding CsgD family transcriptional regulator
LLAGLTEQERKILELIGEGLTNRQIGERLFQAEKTVKNYVSGLYAKLGMERRAQAAALAARVFTDPRRVTLATTDRRDYRRPAVLRRVPGQRRGPRSVSVSPDAWRSDAGMTTTGQVACWVTSELTDPITSRLNPPAPREPTTSMSASLAALISSSTTDPEATRTVTDAGAEPPRSFVAESTSACTTCPAFSART